jgi:hypothetical protein
MAEIEYKTPEDVREEKMRAKADKAYTKSLRNTEEAPAKDPRDAIRGQRGYAKGGSASSRADGCCIKGKTKGTMIMCGGGMTKGK